MPDFNTGIKTNAGIDLFNRVDTGETKIKYTKVVFSSLDLSGATNAQIEEMTDISPQELTVTPQVVLKPQSIYQDQRTNQETEIRATVDNKSLTNGFFVNTYGLYAEDDDDNKVLFGVAVDNHPSYLPAYDGVRPQDLTYEWDTTISDTNDIHFTDTHNAYTTQYDFNDYANNTNSHIKVVYDQLAFDIENNKSSIKSLSSDQSSLASEYSVNNNNVATANNAVDDHVNSAFTTNSNAINVAINQLGADNAMNSYAIKHLGSNVSNTTMKALMATLNQIGADNARLRSKILG